LETGGVERSRVHFEDDIHEAKEQATGNMALIEELGNVAAGLLLCGAPGARQKLRQYCLAEPVATDSWER
jgi:hypothetical protein